MNDYNNIFNVNSNQIDPYQGFVKGNLFNNLYQPYKKYQPKEINPTNEKEYNMTMLQIYDFALHDLDLYLDLYPNDNNIIKLRETYLNEYKIIKKNYETKYGAIDLGSDTLNKAPWGWDSSFPWEVSK